MKAQNTIRPANSFEIENLDKNKCDIVFYTNIIEKEQESTNMEENATIKIYEYDTYRINIDYRDGIKEEIKNNYQEWLKNAKQSEYSELATKIREKRDKLLDATDKFTIIDYPISENSKQEVLEYRQKLRDLPEQEGFPYDIKWPEKPNIEQIMTMKI